MQLEWPDTTIITDEVLQCVQCGEFRPANRVYRDLDHDRDCYCGKCAFWSATPQQETAKEFKSEKPMAMKKKQRP